MEWLEAIYRILQVALGIGFVIFVHELGHFLVAKKVGIRVETFSLGFGPRLLGFRRGGTDYRISAIPLGGYVKMAGENPDELPTGAADEFASKSVGARAAVIVAGVCMNAIFAVFAFLIAFKVGVRMEAPAVGAVQPGSAAEAAGLLFGDRVVRIDGEEPLEFLDLSLAAAYASGHIDVVVDRGGTQATLKVQPRRSGGSPIQQLGFEKMVEVHEVAPGTPAAKAGIQPGDWIIGIGGRHVNGLGELFMAVRESPGKPLPVEIDRGGKRFPVTLTPDARPARTYGIALAPLPVIGSVRPGSAAVGAGLKPGDIVLEIGGAAADVKTFRKRVAEQRPGQPIALKIARDAEVKEVSLVPRPDGDGPPIIGIGYGAAVIGEVAPDSPAAKAGIEPGDRVVGYQGRTQVATFDDVRHFDEVANDPDAEKQPLALKIAKKGSDQVVEVALTPVVVPGQARGDAGLEPSHFAFAQFTKVSPGIVEPIKLGLNRTWAFTEQVILTIQGMFARRIAPETLGGPIGIATAAYAMSEAGLGRLIYFLAIISVNLAVLNIFPIPILDGGHLVFLAIEKVKGSPVAPSVQAAAQWVGLALLLGLMIYVTKNDIVRTFFGG